jgi:CHAD domain-containing protein
MTRTVLRCGDEMWVLNKRDNGHLEASHMKHLRLLFEFTKLGHQRNTDIKETFEVLNRWKMYTIVNRSGELYSYIEKFRDIQYEISAVL